MPRGGLRWLVWIASLLVAVLSAQLVFIEVVETHASTSLSCNDDDGGDDHERDCGLNCHCCMRCAHQGLPAVPALPNAAAPLRLLDFVELPDAVLAHAVVSADRAPPLKVPKHLA
jgi:hypothetical protein